MSVFEEKIAVPTLDESKPYEICIRETRAIENHIEYVIGIWQFPDAEKCWSVTHRFSDFDILHSSLKMSTSNLPSLPPKRIFGNTDKDFINERKASLQNYLGKISTHHFLAISPQFRKFVDPKHYSDRFSEEAHHNILTCLRSSGTHEMTQKLTNIGTRYRKRFFLGTPRNEPKTQHVLSWSAFGPDKMKHLQDIHATLTAFVQCKHPYIVPAVNCIATESGVCTIRTWFSQGSLRDHIYGAKPQKNLLAKYGSNNKIEIPSKSVAIYGRQILEALSFLHEKGIFHGALHSGNVVIDNNVCRLLDLENQVVGLPHILRRFIIKIKKIQSIQAIDVYCFGHLFYEMVFLTPLETENCDNFPSEVSPICRSVLESILSSEALKNGLPSVADLLMHPFFNDIPLISYDKPHLKLPSITKSALAETYDTLLQRLFEDQKAVKKLRQRSRAAVVLAED